MKIMSSPSSAATGSTKPFNASDSLKQQLGTTDTGHCCWNDIENHLESLHRAIEFSKSIIKLSGEDLIDDVGTDVQSAIRTAQSKVKLSQTRVPCETKDTSRGCTWPMDQDWKSQLEDAIKEVPVLIEIRKLNLPTHRAMLMQEYCKTGDYELDDPEVDSGCKDWTRVANLAVAEIEKSDRGLGETITAFERAFKDKAGIKVCRDEPQDSEITTSSGPWIVIDHVEGSDHGAK